MELTNKDGIRELTNALKEFNSLNKPKRCIGGSLFSSQNVEGELLSIDGSYAYLKTSDGSVVRCEMQKLRFID